MVALLRTLVFVSRPLAPSHVEAYRSSVKVVHTGSQEDELALRSLGIFDDPVPFASSFREVASGKSIGEEITLLESKRT